MKKLYLKYILGILLCAISYISYANLPLVGGFGAPQFFTSYDKKAIDEIAVTPHAKHIKVTYPKELKHLASQIKKELVKKSAVRIETEEQNLVDTPTTQYRHDAVIVVVYFR